MLDEPTTGLDPVNVRLVQELLVERQRNGRTTILSTHHMNQVEALCDRVALIDKGRLVVYGDGGRGPAPVFAAGGPGPRRWPAARRCRTSRRSRTKATGTWRLLLSDGSHRPTRCSPRSCTPGAVIDRFEPMLAPMEDIFLRVVREGRA